MIKFLHRLPSPLNPNIKSLIFSVNGGINKNILELSIISTRTFKCCFFSTSAPQNSVISDWNTRYETFLKNKLPTFYSFYRTGVDGNLKLLYIKEF